MKLTATDAAFLHLCSNLANQPSLLLENRDGIRDEILTIWSEKPPCDASEMNAVKWAFMEMMKAAGLEAGGDPKAAMARDGGVAFWRAWQDFVETVKRANRARAAAIMTRHYAGATS